MAMLLQIYRRIRIATDWQLLPGMVKKRCAQRRYWFAVPITDGWVTSRCPDCDGVGSRPTRSAAPI